MKRPAGVTTDAFTISLDCRQDATTERSITPGKRIKHQDTSIDRVGRHQGTFGLAALAITAAALETLHSAADAGPISWWSQPDDLALHRKRREGDMSRINPLDGGGVRRVRRAHT
jgi:hypothetical protein